MFTKETTGTLQVRSNYFDIVMDDPQGVIERAREELADVDFDTFVVTGLSGASVASLLAYTLGKNYLILRKPDDTSTHSSRRAVGKIGKRWVFLDDFICSGDTRDRVMEQLAELLRTESVNAAGHYCPETDRWIDGEPHVSEYVGDYLYFNNMVGPGAFNEADEVGAQEWAMCVEAAADIKMQAW